MLERQDEDGKPRALSRFGELLQHIRVRVPAVPDGFEGLAELVHHQQQRGLLRQAAGDFDDGGRRRPAAADIVRFQIPERQSQRPRRREGPGRGNPAMGAEDCCMKRPQQGVGDRFAARGDEAALEAAPSRSVPPVRLADGFLHAGGCFGDPFQRDLPHPPARPQGGVEQQGERGLPRTVGTGQRPGAPGPALERRRGQPFEHIEGAGGDDVAVERLRPSGVPFEVRGAGEPTADGDGVGQHRHHRAPDP